MKRLWGIRHVRYFWLSYWLNRHVQRCREVGLGYFASEADEKFLQAVWEGEA